MPPPKKRPKLRPAPQAQIRYTIGFPPDVYDLVRDEAEKRHTTLRDVIIRCIESTLLK